MQQAAGSNIDNQLMSDILYLIGNEPAKSRLKSRKSFLNAVKPTDATSIRETLWNERLANLSSSITMSLSANEELPPGADSSWTELKCRNRLRTGTGRCKVNLKQWGDRMNEDVTCECSSEPPSMKHLLRCPLPEQESRAADLAEFSDRAKDCFQLWLKDSI